MVFTFVAYVWSQWPLTRVFLVLGNALGNLGARALGIALQKNSSLQKIILLSLSNSKRMYLSNSSFCSDVFRQLVWGWGKNNTRRKCDNFKGWNCHLTSCIIWLKKSIKRLVWYTCNCFSIHEGRVHGLTLTSVDDHHPMTLTSTPSINQTHPLSTLFQHALAWGQSTIVPTSLFWDYVNGTLLAGSLAEAHKIDREKQKGLPKTTFSLFPFFLLFFFHSFLLSFHSSTITPFLSKRSPVLSCFTHECIHGEPKTPMAQHLFQLRHLFFCPNSLFFFFFLQQMNKCWWHHNKILSNHQITFI